MTDNHAARDQLQAAQRTPIAQLHPDISDPKERVVEGEVTITWPFSIVTKSIAFKLVESDFRLRLNKGQVRVEFHGAAGKAVGKASIGGGDEILLGLDGAEWEKPSAQTPARPDTLEWQLKFRNRLRIKIRRAESREEEVIDLDASETEDEDDAVQPTEIAQPSTPSPLSPIETVPLPKTAAPAFPAKRLASSAFDSDEYASPAFLKRARVSYGSLFEGELDLFANESKRTSRKKRPRFSMHANWRYTSRSPSPEPEQPAESEDEEEPEVQTPEQRPQTPEVPVEPSSQRSMVDEGSQTQAIDMSPSLAVQATAGMQPTVTDAAISPTNILGLNNANGLERMDVEATTTPAEVRQPSPQLPASPKRATETHEIPPEFGQPHIDFSISNGLLHQEPLHQVSSSVDMPFTYATSGFAGPADQHIGDQEAERLFKANDFYTTPMNFGPMAQTHDHTHEQHSPFHFTSPNMNQHSEAFEAPQHEQAPWLPINSQSTYPPIPTHNDASNPVEILDSSSPARAPSSVGHQEDEDEEDRELEDEQPEVSAQADEGHIDSQQPKYVQADESVGKDDDASIQSQVEVEHEDEDGGDIAGEDYDLRNYDDAHDDDDDVKSDQSPQVDESDPDEQVVDLEEDDSDQDDQQEDEEAWEDGEEDYDGLPLAERQEPQQNGEYDVIGEEDEEDEEDLYGEEPYDEDEEDEEEYEEDEADSLPSVSKDPVFISLLSDSEDEAGEEPAPSLAKEQQPSLDRERAVSDEAPEQNAAAAEARSSPHVTEEPKRDSTLGREQRSSPLQYAATAVAESAIPQTFHEPQLMQDDQMEVDSVSHFEESLSPEKQPDEDDSDIEEIDAETYSKSPSVAVETPGRKLERDSASPVAAAVMPVAATAPEAESAPTSDEGVNQTEAMSIDHEEPAPSVAEGGESLHGQEQGSARDDLPEANGQLTTGGSSRDPAADTQGEVSEPALSNVQLSSSEAPAPEATEIPETRIQEVVEESIAEIKQNTATIESEAAGVETSKTAIVPREASAQPSLNEAVEAVQEEAPGSPASVSQAATAPEATEMHPSTTEVAVPEQTAVVSPPQTLVTKEETGAAVQEAEETEGAPRGEEADKMAGINHAGQLPTPKETQEVHGTAILDENEDEDEDDDVTDADYSFAAEQQIMAESQAYAATQEQGTGTTEVASSFDTRSMPSFSEAAEHVTTRSRSKAKAERDVLITVQSLRSWDRRRSQSSMATDEDPSIALAKASFEADTDHSKAQEKTSSPPTLRVTRKRAEEVDPSIQLARAPRTPSRKSRREATPEPTRETGSVRSVSQRLRSKTPETASPVEHLKSSPSVKSAAGEDEQISTLKLKLSKELRTNLPEFLSLKSLRNHFNKMTDIIGVATMTPGQPHRPKGGPRDYMLELVLTDPSSAPSAVSVAHIFRPFQTSLPAVQTGDVVLLRRFQVVSMRGRGFGLRASDASAWAVFEKADEEMLPQIKGPPVELSEQEITHAEGLRMWWEMLDGKAMGKIERATQKALQAGKENKG